MNLINIVLKIVAALAANQAVLQAAIQAFRDGGLPGLLTYVESLLATVPANVDKAALEDAVKTAKTHAAFKCPAPDGGVDFGAVAASVRETLDMLEGCDNKRAAVKAAGCPDPQCDGCCLCCDAGELALRAALASFTCCAGMCGQPVPGPC